MAEMTSRERVQAALDHQELDMWGVARKMISYGAGSYSEIVHYPLRAMETLQEIRQYAFPRVKDMHVDLRVGEIKQLRKTSDQAIVLANANLFETSWYMRGFEKAFEDMLLQPDLIHFIMDRVTTFFTDYFYEILRRCRGEIDMGIDVLQALQFSATNMDPQQLKDKFGKSLCFEGGMCVQKVLPFGTIEEVREEARRLISILGKNGGYLCGPSHFIQAGTPAENITAYFDEAMGFYPFR